LAGSSVTLNGVAAPIFFASPTQINIQVPSKSPPSGSVASAGYMVRTSQGLSDPAPLGAAGSVGIFTLDASGCGSPAVLNVAQDGRSAINSPANSVSPGDFITIYGTGLGAVYNPPPDGIPAPVTPLAPGT